MTSSLFENEFGAIYADRLSLRSVPSDAVTPDEQCVPLSGVLRVAWLYDVQSSPPPGLFSTLRFWLSTLLAMSLLLTPIVNWWAFSSPKWRVIVTLKSGGYVRSAHRDKWYKAEAYAKVARQAAKTA